MTKGQKTALITFTAGLIVEVILDLLYRRWPPISMPLAAGIGAGAWLLLIGRKADSYPSWFGAMLAIMIGLGVVIATTIWGSSCAYPRH